jgi:hypothetical protein
MSADPAKIFGDAVFAVLSGWGALILARENNFGGGDTEQKADDMVDELLDLFEDKPDVKPAEVKAWLLEFLACEFSMECADDSPLDVAKDLCKINKEVLAGKFDTARAVFAKAMKEEDERAAAKEAKKNENVGSACNAAEAEAQASEYFEGMDQEGMGQGLRLKKGAEVPEGFLIPYTKHDRDIDHLMEGVASEDVDDYAYTMREGIADGQPNTLNPKPEVRSLGTLANCVDYKLEEEELVYIEDEEKRAGRPNSEYVEIEGKLFVRVMDPKALQECGWVMCAYGEDYQDYQTSQATEGTKTSITVTPADVEGGRPAKRQKA